MSALPALHALRRCYPEAEIAYLGRQWHAAFLAGRPGPVDRVAVLPDCPGTTVPADSSSDRFAIDAFIDAMRGERFDLDIQMCGGGRYAISASDDRHSTATSMGSPPARRARHVNT